MNKCPYNSDKKCSLVDISEQIKLQQINDTDHYDSIRKFSSDGIALILKNSCFNCPDMTNFILEVIKKIEDLEGQVDRKNRAIGY